jgi:hypothetical protein
MKDEMGNSITGTKLYFLYHISRLLNLAMKNKEKNSMGLIGNLKNSIIDLTQVNF